MCTYSFMLNQTGDLPGKLIHFCLWTCVFSCFVSPSDVDFKTVLLPRGAETPNVFVLPQVEKVSFYLIFYLALENVEE